MVPSRTPGQGVAVAEWELSSCREWLHGLCLGPNWIFVRLVSVVKHSRLYNSESRSLILNNREACPVDFMYTIKITHKRP